MQMALLSLQEEVVLVVQAPLVRVQLQAILQTEATTMVEPTLLPLQTLQTTLPEVEMVQTPQLLNLPLLLQLEEAIS